MKYTQGSVTTKDLQLRQSVERIITKRKLGKEEQKIMTSHSWAGHIELEQE